MRYVFYFTSIILIGFLLASCKPYNTHLSTEEHFSHWDKVESDEDQVYSDYAYEQRSCAVFKVEIPMGKWKVRMSW